MTKGYLTFLLTLLFGIFTGIDAQTMTAQEIVEISNDRLRGTSSYAELQMTIVRPSWTRELEIKSWSKGDDLSMILITAPARDKGTAFLMREREIWNWQPSIDRVIKMPPSMMTQSWMGSDFTNDDLVKQSSIVNDYDQTLLGQETVEGLPCYQVELIPHEDAAVVWGKVVIWIDVEDYMQMKIEFFDEDDYLVNTMSGKDPRMLGGKKLPSTLEVIPADNPGHKTMMVYRELEFDMDVEDRFFSIQNMKRVR